MATFFMFGNYTVEGTTQIGPGRTKRAKDIMKQLGGSLKGAYALLGPTDIVLIVELPGTDEAVKASVLLSRETGISFRTAPAVDATAFDRLVGEI